MLGLPCWVLEATEAGGTAELADVQESYASFAAGDDADILFDEKSLSPLTVSEYGISSC